MTVLSIAFLPAAPLLVPDLAGGSATAEDELRDDCRAALRRALSVDPPAVLVVARAEPPAAYPDSASWDFHGFGVRRNPPPDLPLPWQLGVGAWWLDDAGHTGRRGYLAVTDTVAPQITLTRPTTLLLIGDGSARRDVRAPGHLDPRAEPFDAAIVTALSSGDRDAILDIDPHQAEAMMCSGLAAWRFALSRLPADTTIDTELTVATAPYGVGYFAASWLISPPPA